MEKLIMSMKRKSLPLCFLVFVFLFSCVSKNEKHVLKSQDHSAPFQLLPDESEVSELQLTEEEWNASIERLRELSEGPRIIIKKPQVDFETSTIVLNTPADLLVFFEKNREPVDMNSLNVVAKKGFFSKSLKERLEPFIQGTTLDVQNMELPSGKFRILISIADESGKKTKQEYRLRVH